MSIDIDPEGDPVLHVARWRPRPSHVEARKPDGTVETFAVGEGRRAWQQLRRLLPRQITEIVGRHKGNIVGRWEAPDDQLETEAEAHVENHRTTAAPDPTDAPSPDAGVMRWTAQLMRSIYRDQLDGVRVLVHECALLLRSHREHLTTPTVISAPDDSGGGDEAYTKLISMLGAVSAVLAQQRAAAPGPPPGPPAQPTPPPGFRDGPAAGPGKDSPSGA
jgi:hypothetical protein